MSTLDDVGEADSWRCWLCDAPVDAGMSVNDTRGASIDSITAKTRAKASGVASAVGAPRLAHRGCNTKKGAVAPIVPWPPELFVVDPAPILASVERLARKGGREVMGRCPTAADAEQAATWLADRVSRLARGRALSAEVQRGAGQYLLVMRSDV